MNPLASELNAGLEAAAPEVLAMLSPLGRRLYFPKGILSQSAEAKAKGHRFNATIGIATEAGEAMHLPSVHRYLVDIAPDDAYTYAGGGGRPELRRRWQDKQRAENPSLAGKTFGLPIVTSALTHGLALVGDLFIGPGDRIVLPDKLWGNYRLGYEVRLGAQIATYPFYEGDGFNTTGFAQALEREALGRDKLIVMLNFPNNPTGYMPTEPEGEAIVAALVAQAERGTKLVVVLDDAYFGLFYHLGAPSMTESLFGRLVGTHPNLLAIRVDGATKELFVWGLRCGFLSYGPGRADTADTVCNVLDAKTRGAIRAGISNSPMLSQTIVEKALASPSIDEERNQKCETLRARAEQVYEIAHAPRFRESWEVYPFNSGYFMCLDVKGVDAELLRLHLLDAHATGLIATGKHDLRIAFSCLELDQIEPLFETIHKAIQQLRSQ
ncbi:MAG: aminotransferase class I/II-fold pyridoxal phosphate-dependent enzyme [bacterium]|nr:aminotransferase class I/II-fold pyridoxal phosphate-dependent enzyme [bacterium]MCP5069742.1 aminotransferase class I/II-fold pyridoxal phosphate-dependent enzyme [bacterium]